MEKRAKKYLPSKRSDPRDQKGLELKGDMS